jgi:putative membrane protein
MADRRAEANPGAHFWREAFTLSGAVTRRVAGRVVVFGAVAFGLSVLVSSLSLSPPRAEGLETIGLLLGLFLVFRTAAGADRWWEARRLWGELLNHTRNLAVGAMAYGPEAAEWRLWMARWLIAFAVVTREGLRARDARAALEPLVGGAGVAELGEGGHLPSVVSLRLARLLRAAQQATLLEPAAFLQLDAERAQLLVQVGGCERILNTPIPRVYSLAIRRFVVIYLLASCASFSHLSPWAAALWAGFVSYPILTLEQIGAELQNPFVERSLSHLDLSALSAQLEHEVRSIIPMEEAIRTMVGPLAVGGGAHVLGPQGP